MALNVQGIPVEVVRKNIKNMYLSVQPPDGHVRITAPKSMSAETIKRFVESKLNWIRKHQKKYERWEKAETNVYKSGEILYLWGKPYILEVMPEEKRNVWMVEEDRVILRVKPDSTQETRQRLIKELYRFYLKKEAPGLFKKWEQITGLSCLTWQGKDMKTRWGTCNTSTGKIWISLKLAKKPLICLEYVILHELLHLKVSNHGPEFKGLLDQYMPSWREYKKLLNQ